MQTGDILLFSWPATKLTKQMENSSWTHVGMVYRNDGKINLLVDRYDPSAAGPLFMIEAIGSGPSQNEKKDINTAVERVVGVDLRQLFNKMYYYTQAKDYRSGFKTDPFVGWRPLTAERTPEFLKSVETLYEKYKDKKYEQNAKEMKTDALNCDVFCCTCCYCPCCENKPDDSSLFCSELVAYFYQEMGILDKKRPANEYMPSDFSTDNKLSLLNGAKLSDKEYYFVFKDGPSPPPPTPVAAV